MVDVGCSMAGIISSPRVQIIKRKVDVKRFSGNSSTKYYQQLRHSIKKSVNGGADLLMIELIPDVPVEDRITLKVLLLLQREFTPVLITPGNTTVSIRDEEIKEWTERFNASVLMIGV